MRVGVIQSSFIPWRGYFDFIASVDVFVFYEDVQYTKGDWRNRNRIKTAQGSEWLTVPVYYKTLSKLICDTEIDYSTPWGTKHLRLWQTHYRDAAYLGDVLKLLDGIDTDHNKTISQLNIQLTKRICGYLDIKTPMLVSTGMELSGSKTARLIDLLQKLDASSYLSGPSASAYLDLAAFVDAGIGLEYKSYDYAPYPQLWGAFDGAMTVLDLIANIGPEARHYIKSRTSDTVSVPARRRGGGALVRG